MPEEEEEGRRVEGWMREALAEARASMAAGEVPVGCVVVRRGSGDRVLARGHNETNQARSGIRHAELVCVDRALANHGEVRWGECEFFVSLEPCIMCAGALALLGPKHVYFGGPNHRFGGCGSVLDVAAAGCGACGGRSAGGGGGGGPGFRHTGGFFAEEAVDLLREFYEKGNPKGEGEAVGRGEVADRDAARRPD